MSDCGCDEKRRASSGKTFSTEGGGPILEPSHEGSKSNGENAMSKPILIPSAVSNATGGAGTAMPTLTPSSIAAESGITAWIGDKRVSGLWTISENRNSWVYLTPDVGWKKLADNSDSAAVALSILAAHAKQSQTNYSYREESDGKIHEVYAW